MKTVIRSFLKKVLRSIIDEAIRNDSVYKEMKSKLEDAHVFFESSFKASCKLYPPYSISFTNIGDYTYVSQNACISKTDIGKFCSIGPNLLCGWGIHPTIGISTSPMFYSTRRQNGQSFSVEDKIDERKHIKVGNDVFIGANVIILDGVTVNDGAIIGAGTVVSKDIPPYAIAVGCPVQIIKYRFDDTQIEKFLRIKWWEFPEDKLRDVEKYFFEVNEFLEKYLNA